MEWSFLPVMALEKLASFYYQTSCFFCNSQQNGTEKQVLHLKNNFQSKFSIASKFGGVGLFACLFVFQEQYNQALI